MKQIAINLICLKNIFKRGYEEIRDRKLLLILKKDRKWLKYGRGYATRQYAPD
jgi:hypothetical protein